MPHTLARTPHWRKSTRSGNSGNCVEVAAGPVAVGVRDSKDPGGPELWVEPSDWRAFTAALVGR
ncbi:hypothetical protein Lfu02_23840 [Longispora fulva]|uniref:DUF397 domain-containing protein n=1 Tax=Longispora fulva TaxID=619741 RepID=A0A8J7KIS8_9ACTN|nr:DUF397 domain-containing protein [Longispora fulva]MBG6139605.1 hypothetical protein [Longispora fulva]GIG58012.1 hypothetical protein Lfu02_23840 [Longispora fulva]